MSYNFFNTQNNQQQTSLASPLPRNKEQQQEYYANEKSFLSDFNIEDELFGGINNGSIGGQDDSILPLSKPFSQGCQQSYQQATLMLQESQMPHRNNELLNKLVGTKRRKCGPYDPNLLYQEHQGAEIESQYLSESLNSSTRSSQYSRQVLISQRAQAHLPSTKERHGGDYRDDVIVDDQGIYFYDHNPGEYKKAKKRMQNRESALRTRIKKKDYYHSVESQLSSVQQENNKLKLDNAALRAENSLLKRQLTYFENLFAKKTQSTATQSSIHSGYIPVSQNNSNAQSRVGGLSDDEIYNNKQLPFYIKKRTSKQRNDDICSQASGDNEATRLAQEKYNNSEVSFVLERKTTDSTGTPSKLGLFSIALVMCVCCLSSFFAPLGSSGSPVAGAVKVGMEYAGGRSLKTITGNDSEEYSTDDEITVPIVDMPYSVFCLGNILKLLFLICFAISILTFPVEEIKQWAARKSWLRKIFNLSDVPIQTHKSIKRS